jgi:Tannase and feruloyl esterase
MPARRPPWRRTGPDEREIIVNLVTKIDNNLAERRLPPPKADGRGEDGEVPPAYATQTSHSQGPRRRAPCSDGGSRDRRLSGRARVRSSGLESQVGSATAGGPQYCALTGHIAANIGFEILLPTETWHERYLQIGCGGLCGSIGHGSD